MAGERRPALPLRQDLEAWRRLLKRADARLARRAWRALSGDPRRTAARLVERAQAIIKAHQRELRRVRRLLGPERALWRQGLTLVAGVDEVGVGPLAGPVVAAAVIMPAGVACPKVDDSKRLDAATREALDGEIRRRAVALGIGMASPAEIDSLNIYHASLLAMRRAVSELPLKPCHLLVDARTVPECDMPQTAIIDGDRKSHAIACASIVAKVYRDRLMVELGARHPGYGFERHKGYSTRAHFEAIRQLGPSPAHRRSFVVLGELAGGLSPAFYQLKQALAEAACRDALAAVRAMARENTLSEPERRKLLLLAARRERSLAKE